MDRAEKLILAALHAIKAKERREQFRTNSAMNLTQAKRKSQLALHEWDDWGSAERARLKQIEEPPGVFNAPSAHFLRSTIHTDKSLRT